ncbi:MAG: HlyD family efflux transporter periplasmic adaptor subunit [Caldilineaceae bacterium]|nr:HlyD family efflux transporter periplasmic adaptor subunit [Caldilineaceae bacterium]
MRRVLWIVGVIAVIGVAAWGYQQYQAQQAAEVAAEQAQNTEVDDLANVIWASGKLEPILWAGLSPAVSGLVSFQHVEEGAWVEAGDLLLELDNGVAQSQVTMAAAALAEAQAALAKLEAGATAAEIAAANAQVAAAEANIALAASRMLEMKAAIDATQTQVSQAQRQYAELASHPTEAEQTAAAAQVAVAQAGVRQAQAAYNLVRGDPQLAARPEALTLMQMTASLEAAQAQSSLTASGPSQQQLAVAAGLIDVARAQIAVTESQAPGVEAGVRAAMAQRDSAQAELDRILAGATAEERAIATARVQAAQAALTSAQSQLAQSQIIAPFAGQVGAVNVRVGELVSPGDFALQLGDTQQMYVSTTDLRETDVVRLRVGMPVEVTFDALPDVVFQGTVVRIAPMSSAAQGSTNYTVKVEVTDLDPSLRWGMTAFVNIRTEP